MFRDIFSIKYGALALLVLQNTFLVVYMGYSRTLKGPMYASSTAVTIMECVKLVCCLLVIIVQTGGLRGLFFSISEEIISKPVELLKLSVPSLLYTIQNNLLYYALTHLDAATFQVGYQVKILTTAGDISLSALLTYIYLFRCLVFSVFMLGKQISSLQ